MDFDYKLLARYLIDELSPEEYEALIDWRDRSDENSRIFSELVKLRISQRYMWYDTPGVIEEALDTVNTRIGKMSRRHLFRTVIRYASAILLLFAFSYGGWNYLRPESCVTISVKQGENMRKIALADGTAVWLKEGSSLRIPEVFAQKNRKVSLWGEAYFDVSKNSTLPFYVFTDYMSIKVLGTAFSVKVDDRNKNVETVLARGKVALLDKEQNRVLDMLPDEKVTFYSKRNEYITELVDANISTAWHLNQFVFENVTLREIVNQLSAKFNVNINLESSRLAHRKFRCVVNADESLPEILKLLELLVPIKYRIEGDEIFIYE